MTDRAEGDGFVAFFRRYARTWIHAVATAGLTAFGTLTVVHRGFAALAIGAYVVPPVALYLAETVGSGGESSRAGGSRARDAGPAADQSDAVEPGTDEASEPDEPEAAAERAAVDEGPRGWTTSDSPVGSTLRDVAVTTTAAHAVGDGGVVLADRGDGWTVTLADGPGADANTLRGVDATADGDAVWTAGDGGAVGRIDAGSGRHVDFSAPRGITNAWVDVAVGGGSGAETVLLIDGSGQAVRGRYREGEVAWTDPVKPGGGSSFAGVDFADGSAAFLCDTNDGVYETGDAGETFRRVGVEGADGTLTDVAATDPGSCLACADDGVVHRYEGGRWTPDRLGDDALRAVACHRGYAAACGEGAVHERTDAGGWSRTATPATGALRGVAAGADRAVAVGDDGVVVERRLEE